jgi:hypothetical protein
MNFDSTQAMFDIADRLHAFPGLTAVEIVTEKPRLLSPEAALYNPVAVTLAAITGAGSCLLVVEPDLAGTSLSDPLYFKSVTFEIVAFSNLLLSGAPGGSALRSFQLARLAARALHLFSSPPDYNDFLIAGIQPFRGAGLPSDVIEKFQQANAEGHVLKIVTQIEEDKLNRLAPPTLSCASVVSPQTVTATHAVAGARLYYTLDGTFPGSGRRSLTGPDPAEYVLSGSTFQVDHPCKLRVAAEAAGYEPSIVHGAIFT